MSVQRVFRRLAAVILMILIIACLSACSKAEDETNSYDLNTVEGLKEYMKGKKLVFKTGTLYDTLGPQWFPDSDYLQLNNESDSITALLERKADLLLVDKPVAIEITKRTEGLRMSEAVIMTDSYGFIFNLSNTQLRDEMNETLRRFKEDGTLRRIIDSWSGDDRVMPDIKLTGENGTLKIATSAVAAPFSYREGEEIKGINLDFLTRFCAEYGYNYEVQIMDFSGIIAAVSSGKCDIGMDAISITDERRKAVNFSDEYYEGGTVGLLRSEAFGETAELPKTLEELQKLMSGKRSAVITGSVQETITRESFPDTELLYFTNVTDIFQAIEDNRADIFFNSIAAFDSYKETNPETSLTIPDIVIDKLECGYILNKNNTALRDQMNEFIEEILANGTRAALTDKWSNPDNFEMVSDKYKLTGENGTLILATGATDQPFEFVMDGEVTGDEIEIIYMFCEQYGYGLTINTMEFADVIAAVQSGKADIGANTIVRTDEREEMVLFTTGIDATELYAVIRDTTIDEESNTGISDIFKSISESFRRTFIEEGRWKLILQGLLVTVIISVCSCIFGSILGFGICMANRSGHAGLHIPARILIKVIQGTPIVVILMILYFIIFGDIDPVFVAIVGFSINFGVYVSEMMRTGIEAVDKGQIEAAGAIGFTKVQSFIQIVMPQAAKHFLPVFRGEFISMVKMTSIVGYISIQDLTKMSDIIRSRIYEAFFPLIATAIIYFLLSWLLTLIITYVEKKIDPKHRKRMIKGVCEHD